MLSPRVEWTPLNLLAPRRLLPGLGLTPSTTHGPTNSSVFGRRVSFAGNLECFRRTQYHAANNSSTPRRSTLQSDRRSNDPTAVESSPAKSRAHVLGARSTSAVVGLMLQYVSPCEVRESTLLRLHISILVWQAYLAGRPLPTSLKMLKVSDSQRRAGIMGFPVCKAHGQAEYPGAGAAFLANRTISPSAATHGDASHSI